jgi:hypothetical protein
MSKVITSPVKKFPGTVTISDPLTYPQCFALEDGFEAVAALDKNAGPRRIRYAVLPGIMACVEAWNIEGFPENVTAETFPASPGIASAELLDWLIGEITAIQKGDEVPNE